MMPPRDGLSAAIAQEEARLAKLDRERDEIRARLDALRQESSHAPMPIATTAHLPLLASRGVPTTPIEKVRLFRSLFRGREGVFPTRFVSKKTGKAGYAPACANKFVRGVCELPRVKCAECPNQAFLPVADQAVLDHLRGRHVMGVYPLLEDETCWFLAADFDQASWRDDIVAFGQTCRSAGVPVAVERSRSGNGAHAWVFFAAPVPASAARKMGCYLITETMSRRHQLGMASYDRLFPNQDTMPRGGFGNLIALPLEYRGGCARPAGTLKRAGLGRQEDDRPRAAGCRARPHHPVSDRRLGDARMAPSGRRRAGGRVPGPAPQTGRPLAVCRHGGGQRLPAERSAARDRV